MQNFELSITNVFQHAHNGEYFQVYDPHITLNRWDENTIPGHWVRIGYVERFVRYIMSYFFESCVLSSEEQAVLTSLSNLIICARGVSNVALEIGVEIFEVMEMMRDGNHGTPEQNRLRTLLQDRIGSYQLSAPSPTVSFYLNDVHRETAMRFQFHRWKQRYERADFRTAIEERSRNLRPVNPVNDSNEEPVSSSVSANESNSSSSAMTTSSLEAEDGTIRHNTTVEN